MVFSCLAFPTMLCPVGEDQQRILWVLVTDADGKSLLHVKQMYYYKQLTNLSDNYLYEIQRNQFQEDWIADSYLLGYEKVGEKNSITVVSI